MSFAFHLFVIPGGKKKKKKAKYSGEETRLTESTPHQLQGIGTGDLCSSSLFALPPYKKYVGKIKIGCYKLPSTIAGRQ